MQFDHGALSIIKDVRFRYDLNVCGTTMESSNYDGAPTDPRALTERIVLVLDGESFDSVIDLEIFGPSYRPIEGGERDKAHGVRVRF